VADPLKRVVVDTCVILDMLLDEDADLAARAEYLLAGHGSRHTVVLPAIVIPEIAGASSVRGTQLQPEERARRVKAAEEWIRGNKFIVAELSERTARRAADLAVAYSLKGADAAVLATADESGCARLYTRDGNLLRCDGRFRFTISHAEDPPPPVVPDPDLFSALNPDR
jgi:predicted nucleic acid-binding protein